MENKMEEVSKILGVKLGEPFNIKGKCIGNPYRLTNNGLIYNDGEYCDDGALSWLLRGKFTIEKIPFKPSCWEEYYFINEFANVVCALWSNSVFDFYFYNANNCFRTFNEITEEDKKRILKEMKGKYDGK